MSFYAISALANAITSLILGALVLSRNVKNKVNITFALFTLAITVWSIGYFFWQIALTAPGALLWSKIFMAAAIFIPIFYFHFTVTFLGIEKTQKIFVWIAYILGLFFFILNFTPYFIASVTPKLSFAFWPNPGIFYHSFLAAWFLYVVYTTYLLYKEFRTKKSTRHDQLKYILIGMVVGYLGGITNYFLWYDIPIPPVGNILVSVYVIMVAYAILRHHLFSIKVIATELLIISLWVLIFIRTLLSETLWEQLLNGSLLVSMMVLGVFLIQSVIREAKTREKIEHLAKQLKGENKRLRELSRQKSEFVSIASHQLKTPLTAIKGYASMLLEGSFGALTEAIREAVEKIYRSSQSLVVIVDDFLIASNIEHGQIQYRFNTVKLKNLVEEVVSNLTSPAKKKGLAINVQAEDGDSYSVMADHGKIKQVLHSIIHNAINYTGKGFVNVSLSKNKESGKIRIAVSDSGAGIRKDIMPRQKVTRQHEVRLGPDLELYAAKEIIKAHGGNIWVDSRGEGRGSTFFIELAGVKPRSVVGNIKRHAK
ncbi:MAG: hypothetical protein BMS9Abin13_088 [Patescibacteria group bacterium]|nr:MAG: hypothetical protein BMS9Abin13_088 [Patescibacteria group bacterium]